MTEGTLLQYWAYISLLVVIIYTPLFFFSLGIARRIVKEGWVVGLCIYFLYFWYIVLVAVFWPIELVYRPLLRDVLKGFEHQRRRTVENLPHV